MESLIKITKSGKAVLLSVFSKASNHKDNISSGASRRKIQQLSLKLRVARCSFLYIC